MTRDPIDELIDGVIAREGGDVITDRPADTGGLTRAGLTLTTASRLLGHPLTADAFRALPFATIRDLYRQAFVGPFAALPEPLRTLVVDYAVNSGPDDPTRAIQTCVGIHVDGVFGPQTRAALAAHLQAHGQAAVYVAVLADRIRHDVDLVVRDPAFVAFVKTHPTTQAANLHGWLNRCLTFLRPVS